jgi:PqqD family protein of HPr-rel-A system
MPVRFLRNPSVEGAPLQNEVMLFNMATNKFCVLNASAAHIWERLAEPSTEDELIGSVCAHFQGAGRASVEQDVRAVLGQLEGLELVTRQA